MQRAHPTEREVGIEWYVSESEGIGGVLRGRDEDFRVREIEHFETQPLDASPDAYPDVVFRTTLRGWDTNDFVSRLSNELGISRERLSWAGTKDKHAVTTQLFSVRGVDPDQFPEISRTDVEFVGRAGRPIEFGDLVGNEFEVVVSEASTPGRAEDVLRELREFGGEGAEGDAIGIPNWFGQQRFGSQRPVTHEVGLHVAGGEWEKAVLSYVGNPFEAESEGTRRARERADEAAKGDRDWAGVLEEYPRRLRYERSMLHTLAENGGETPADFREALETVPSNLQRLFVHAAQSYAFNLMLSERLERGLPFDRPVAGDVACFSDRGGPAELVVPDIDRLQRVTPDRVDTMERHCSRGRAFVTAPLVGTETELADGEQGDIERSVLDELGLEPEDFDLPGEFDSTGTRRAILLRTEMDVTTGDERATFEFGLPKGSYATVVLREFLKADPIEMG
ncbi:tRNA pseudouridine(13) synthase TruD [Natranaeroarchaeum sulfidigenes]|uniref:Probable tRNA pseudouridine synthase D n=1 Tax=Natranaeroarchaeum sulfidigenes TaxID=2784880 RepID=A0A897MYI1_9EURY|nr:tRNA pseudouridine(13) synthase TruD [Natranaeroarchaeum sulfidigenes]QSG03176.1 tRNA(Glu) U13 pseudouridine synthase TruD [Natranaeroarchaeum sulfidigenes]